jgi:hypothetical protein
MGVDDEEMNRGVEHLSVRWNMGWRGGGGRRGRREATEKGGMGE